MDDSLPKSTRVKRRTRAFRKKQRQKRYLLNLPETEEESETPTAKHSWGPIYSSATETIIAFLRQKQQLEEIKRQNHLYCLSCNTFLFDKQDFGYIDRKSVV